MANRPKDKGTAAESAVVAYLCSTFWPYAERRALRGSVDCGDIAGTPGLAWEVKCGDSGLRLGEWLVETSIERVNAGADFGVLVAKPAGVGTRNTGLWLAAMVSSEFDRLVDAAFNAILEDPTKAPEPDLTIVHAPAATYVAANVRPALTVGVGATRHNELYALTLRPPGSKEQPNAWYRVMQLQQMTRLLHAAGYGSRGNAHA